MPTKIERNFDLNQVNNRVSMELGGATAATVQLTLLSDTTPPSFVVTIKRSLDGETWVVLESTQTFSQAAYSDTALSSMTNKIDCAGFSWIAAEVTTAAGSALEGRLIIFANRTF